MDIKIVTAPRDPFVRPPHKPRRRWKVGDHVRTPSGYVGTIERVERNMLGRDGKPLRRVLYRVDLPTAPGSPRVVFAGWELERVR